MVFQKILLTASILVLGFLVDWLWKHFIKGGLENKGIRIAQKNLVKRIINFVMFFLVALALVSVWGVDVHNLWLFFTSVVGLIAIGFFAVWSILSNVITGIIIIISKDFRIGDELNIQPENISGNIVDMSLLFLKLEDKEGFSIHIPNNLVFQRIVRKKRSKN